MDPPPSDLNKYKINLLLFFRNTEFNEKGKKAQRLTGLITYTKEYVSVLTK